MMIVTWDNIKEMNDQIGKDNLDYKVHLSDACSGQCMWLEDLKHEGFTQNERLEGLLRDYFKAEKSEIVFSENKKSFWTRN